MKRYTFRLYNRKPVNTWQYYVEGYSFPWTYQVEYEYTEYRTEDGSVKQTGTEDFAYGRNSELRTAWLWTWDGKKFNKGGHRFFTLHYLVTYNRNEVKEVKEYFKKKYNAEIVELR